MSEAIVTGTGQLFCVREEPFGKEQLLVSILMPQYGL
jgi:hypothetical protein